MGVMGAGSTVGLVLKLSCQQLCGAWSERRDAGEEAVSWSMEKVVPDRRMWWCWLVPSLSTGC